ncbi:DnaJ domain-containing protein [Mycoplasmoides genitalium]
MAEQKRDYYEVLGITPDADQSEIKKAFRKLAKKYHPDRNNAPDAAKIFAEINEANDVLSNPKKRANYDKYGFDGVDGEPAFNFQADVFQSFFEEIAKSGVFNNQTNPEQKEKKKRYHWFSKKPKQEQPEINLDHVVEQTIKKVQQNQNQNKDPDELRSKVPGEVTASDWEALVGDTRYGYFDETGDWSWKGYFDEQGKWVWNEPVDSETSEVSVEPEPTSVAPEASFEEAQPEINAEPEASFESTPTPEPVAPEASFEEAQPEPTPIPEPIPTPVQVQPLLLDLNLFTIPTKATKDDLLFDNINLTTYEQVVDYLNSQATPNLAKTDGELQTIDGTNPLLLEQCKKIKKQAEQLFKKLFLKKQLPFITQPEVVEESKTSFDENNVNLVYFEKVPEILFINQQPKEVKYTRQVFDGLTNKTTSETITLEIQLLQTPKETVSAIFKGFGNDHGKGCGDLKIVFEKIKSPFFQVNEDGLHSACIIDPLVAYNGGIIDVFGPYTNFQVKVDGEIDINAIMKFEKLGIAKTKRKGDLFVHLYYSSVPKKKLTTNPQVQQFLELLQAEYELLQDNIKSLKYFKNNLVVPKKPLDQQSYQYLSQEPIS